jgi:hypothetical protein
MKATLEVMLESGIKLEVSNKLERLSDLASFARALLRKSRDASRLFPALATQKVASFRLRSETNPKPHRANKEPRAAE